MQTNLSVQEIHQILDSAGIAGFTGECTGLGGGEDNDSYRLTVGGEQMVLRIAKDARLRTLENEAIALQLLRIRHVPRFIFFNKRTLQTGREWILESYIAGHAAKRLSLRQLRQLGHLLAQVHKVTTPDLHVILKDQFLDSCKLFGNEQYIWNHPHAPLRGLIRELYTACELEQSAYDAVVSSLTHKDVTPSNILVDGDHIGLIDWEFSRFSDPMSDFPTFYYEDMELNDGKWRIHITPEEKRALFEGYEQGGGTIDEARIRFWMRLDKLSAAVFLYWRLHVSKRELTKEDRDQHGADFRTILASLSSTEAR